MNQHPAESPHHAAQAQASFLRKLNQHQQRRDAGIPMLSVLVGPQAEAVALWRDWALTSGKTPLLIVSADRHPVQQAAGEWAAQPWIVDRLIEYMAPALAMHAHEVRNILSAEPCRERFHLVHQLLSASPSHAVETLCRYLLVESRADTGSWNTGTAGTLIRGLSSVEGHRAPGLLFHSFPADESTARALTDVVELCPLVPVGWAVPASEYALCMKRMPPSRAGTMCREGVVGLQSPTGGFLPQDPGSKKAAVGAERFRRDALLRLAGQEPSKTLLERYAEALAAGEKAGEDDASAEKARSAAEAFLYDLLESLPETAGLFELNGRLAADWGSHGTAEVDLLCRSRRLALEIDGYYHFCSPDGYRRDRRKDVLLQQQEFLVLRFLAEDVVAGLEMILETVLNSLKWCENRDRPGGVRHE